MLKKMPAPTTFRDFLHLFRFYRSEVGLEGIFDHVELRGVEPRHVYYVVHGRPPESIDTALSEREYSIKDIFAAATRSSEFREHFIARFLDAFPEKRRLLFVHIPKCAGSNLSSHLIGQFPSLRTTITDEGLTSEEDFLLAVKHLVLEVEFSECIYVHGHVHLNTYEEWGAIRVNDDIFTVLRDPLSLAVSQINYVMTRIFSNEKPVPTDTLGWREEFAITATGDKPSQSQISDLCGKILAHRGVLPEDLLCRFIGNGTFDLAVERIVTRNVEVTDISRYNRWCSQRWNIAHAGQSNGSSSFISWSDLPKSYQDTIFDITSEDRRLYKMVSDRLEKTDKVSLVGRDLIADR